MPNCVVRLLSFVFKYNPETVYLVEEVDYFPL